MKGKTVTQNNVSDNFSENISTEIVRNKGTAGKQIIMDGLSVNTVARDGNCLFRSLCAWEENYPTSTITC
jgi:hypothetical protein